MMAEDCSCKWQGIARLVYKGYNIDMKLKLGLIIIFSLLTLISACSTVSTTTPVQEPINDQNSILNKEVPIVPPTFTIDQPAGLNPGKFLGTVYVSDRDHLFHREDCFNLGIPNTPIDRQQALIEGYNPCPVCNP